MKKLLMVSLVLAATQAGAEEAQSNSNSAPANSGKSSVKVEAVKPANNNAAATQDGEKDVDEVITNKKLRAETGSKSKYSISSSLSYSGGSLEKPLDKKRPNIRGGVATPTDAALGGQVGVKYKINATNSLNASIGVRVGTPFHSDDKTIMDRTFADNPSIGYTTIYRAAGIQNVTSADLTYFTSEEGRKWGYVGAASLSQTAIYDFGGSPFSVGLSAGVSASNFDKKDDLVAVKTKKGTQMVPAIAQQADYDVALYPFLEYQINDRYNFRTLLGQGWEHARGESRGWTFSRLQLYQSMGLGISVTRDVYIYPNIQFLPENIRADLTNVAVSANINVF